MKKKLKQTIGERSVLCLDTVQALTVHAVFGKATETPNKNWRAFCAVLALNLSPRPLALSLPPSLADFGPQPLPLGYTQGPLRADRPTPHLGAMCGRTPYAAGGWILRPGGVGGRGSYGSFLNETAKPTIPKPTINSLQSAPPLEEGSSPKRGHYFPPRASLVCTSR